MYIISRYLDGAQCHVVSLDGCVCYTGQRLQCSKGRPLKGRLMSTLTTPSQQVALWSQQGAQVNSQQPLTTAHNML